MYLFNAYRHFFRVALYKMQVGEKVFLYASASVTFVAGKRKIFIVSVFAVKSRGKLKS